VKLFCSASQQLDFGEERGCDKTTSNNLTSICSYIANKISEYNQQHATPLNLFITVRRCTCFRRFFLSIIRSSKLHIQRQAFVRPLLLPAAKPGRDGNYSSIPFRPG